MTWSTNNGEELAWQDGAGHSIDNLLLRRHAWLAAQALADSEIGGDVDVVPGELNEVLIFLHKVYLLPELSLIFH